MTSPLNLDSRARECAMTTFTLRQAVGEAMGYASRCWDENGVFESEKASEAVDDLLNAIAAFTKHAINYQSLDARCDMNDGEMVELIFQVPAMGYEPSDSQEGGA